MANWYLLQVKEMAWVNKISKSPQSHKLLPSHSLLPGRAPRAAGALRTACSVGLWASAPPTHTGDASSHKKKIPRCPEESLPTEPFQGRSELT